MLYFQVYLIIGLTGAFRRNELIKMSTNDIQGKGNVLVIINAKKKTDTECLQ